MNDYRRLAALAVFRELYDSRKNLNDILHEFIVHTIVSQHLRSFSAHLIATKIEETFGLRVPEAVAKTALNTFSKKVGWCKKLGKEFSVDHVPEGLSSEVQQKYANRQSVNKDVFKRLEDYINSRRGKPLNAEERKTAHRSLCAFLLNEKNGEAYSEYISSFVLANEDDDQFQSDLNEIREGVILYSGITYNDNPAEVGSWKNELTLFLDQEILFHCCGLNGELFKSYFEDFNRFVIEINTSGKRKLIHLRYFQETKDEIDAFYAYAERVVRNEAPSRPGNAAMSNITNGCQTASAVRAKRTNFFHYLDNIGIRMDDTFVFDESKFPHNILSSDVVEELFKDVWKVNSSTDPDEKMRLKNKAEQSIKLLNKIHCMRGNGHHGNFYTVKYHLLTGTAKTIEAAWHKKIKGDEAIPLATSLDWITNTFWFKLNKGFHGEKFPSSSQALAKARVVLSTVVNRSVGKKFDDLVVQHKRGELSKKLVQARILDLMERTVRPEDISAQSIDLALDIIQRGSLEHFKAEQEASELQQKEQCEENERLRQELEQQSHEICKLKIELERQENTRKLDSKLEEISKLESTKAKADKCSSWCCRAIYAMFATLLAVGIGALTRHFTNYWDVLGPKLAAIQIASPAIAFMIVIVFGSRLTPESARIWLEKLIKKRMYALFSFREEQLQALKDQAEQLNNNL